MDKDIGPVIKWVRSGQKPDTLTLATCSAETKALVSQWSSLRITDDSTSMLVKTGLTSRLGKPIVQIILPKQLREIVLHQLHDLRIAGHLGIQRTIARVQRRFYWPGLSLDVARWCAACPTCAGRKGKPGPGRVPMTNLPTGAAFERIGIDILDTRKVTPRRYQYVLVITDYFTKYTDAFPLRRHTAAIVADTIMRRWIAYHGVPKQIHSDQGAEFEGQLMQSLSRLLGFSKIRTTPYRPQSDGQVERFNRSLLNMLSAFVTDRANDWDEHLPYVMMAYRSSRNSSTGCTPYSMIYGRECTMPIDLMFPDPSTKAKPNPSCGPEYVDFVRSAIRTAHEFAREHLHRSAVRQKRGYDVYAKDRPPFQIGDFVRYYYPPASNTNKFARPWIGPFKVLERVTDVDYKIQLVSDPKKTRTIHIDNLKPYETPYNTEDIPDPAYDPPASILDEIVDPLDSDVTNPSPLTPETIPFSAPEQLQTQEEARTAHQKVKREIRKPQRYIAADPPGDLRAKTTKKKKPTKKERKIKRKEKKRLATRELRLATRDSRLATRERDSDDKTATPPSLRPRRTTRRPSRFADLVVNEFCPFALCPALSVFL